MYCCWSVPVKCQFVNSSTDRVRHMHTANISKLAVLKDKKLLPPRNLIQSSDRLVAEVVDDIGMGLQDTNVLSHFLSQP